MQQGSAEWFAARCGKATASEFSSILAKGQGKMRAAYLRRIVAERLTGKSQDSGYHNSHMDRGQEQEPFARMAYESRTGCIVEEVGFVQHPTLMIGCSPDGLLDGEGGAEIKSVIPTVQLETILSGEYPSEHRAQVQGSLWITGRAWWDFCSFSNDMPGNLQLYVFRVVRDEDYIKELAGEVMRFLSDVDALVSRLLSRPSWRPQSTTRSVTGGQGGQKAPEQPAGAAQDGQGSVAGGGVGVTTGGGAAQAQGRSRGTPKLRKTYLEKIEGSTDWQVLDLLFDEAISYDWSAEESTAIKAAYQGRRKTLREGAK